VTRALGIDSATVAVELMWEVTTPNRGINRCFIEVNSAKGDLTGFLFVFRNVVAKHERTDGCACGNDAEREPRDAAPVCWRALMLSVLGVRLFGR
jgi:hypothetical protein